ncbi:MAG: MBL fold metallo-hydrolase, partial [Dehalococcoidia bacterium]|nr:MBL fold metallo-hydrolase [Dehalococcoidia bacterium]
MEITWLGHACFRLRGKEGVVITDPYDSSAGYPPLKVTATIVTVSHDDPKHNHTAAVGGSPTIVDRPGEYEIATIPIVGVRTYRDKTKGATLGKNVSYLFEIEDVTIVHLGAIGHVPTADTVQQLGDVGVLLVPVGGKTTLDATGAV